MNVSHVTRAIVNIVVFYFYYLKHTDFKHLSCAKRTGLKAHIRCISRWPMPSFVWYECAR